MSSPETWRPVVGFEGDYEVSDHGNLRSLKYGKVRPLRTYLWGPGYLYCQLSKDGKSSPFSVHRLVALAFLGMPDGDRDEINHIDGDKLNNHVSNLEWCTRLQNMRHASAMGLLSVPHPTRRRAA